MSLSFVERSAHTLGQVDPEEIAAQQLGDVVFENNFFVRMSLGKVAAGSGESLHMGIELPRRRCTSQMLAFNNLVQISYMFEQEPELTAAAAPSFAGMLAHEDEDYWAKGALVEDISEGGRYKFGSHEASPEMIEKCIRLGVQPSGYHGLMTGDVAGNEKIVNFFPAPFRMTLNTRDRLNDEILCSQKRLTVTFGAATALARDLMERERRLG